MFIKVTTVDTVNSVSYKTADGLEKRIKETKDEFANDMEKYKEQEEISVINGNRNKKVNSDVETRNYEIVVIVPEDTDDSLIEATRNKIMNDSEYIGYTIQIQQRYGKAS